MLKNPNNEAHRAKCLAVDCGTIAGLMASQIQTRLLALCRYAEFPELTLDLVSGRRFQTEDLTAVLQWAVQADKLSIMDFEVMSTLVDNLDHIKGAHDEMFNWLRRTLSDTVHYNVGIPFVNGGGNSVNVMTFYMFNNPKFELTKVETDDEETESVG